MFLSEIENILSPYENSSIIFVGLGNEFRGDDGAGIYLLNQLKQNEKFNGCIFLNAHLNPENYLSFILECEPSSVVFTDTARWGGHPGEVRLFRSSDIDNISFSTHSYSIKLLEEYLLNFIKVDVYYLGIQPFSTGNIKKLSDQILTGVKEFLSV